GIVTFQFGKGTSALITFPVGSLYDHTRHYGHSALMLSVLTELLGHQSSITTDASPLLELSHQVSHTGSFEWFGLMNHSGQLGNGFFKPQALPAFNLHFRPAGEVKGIRLLRADRSVEFKVGEDGQVGFEIDGLEFYDIALVTYD
ncbi:MAG: hypothetical protein KAT15_10710, partial [Bacteroidales bacterium]|nr:hypothetical protein [Bacteroidales bacterium]